MRCGSAVNISWEDAPDGRLQEFHSYTRYFMRLNFFFVWLIMASAVAFMVWYFYQMVGPPKGDVTVYLPENRPDTAIFEVHSQIEAPVARKLREAEKDLSESVQRIVIDLDSPGGSLAEGRKIINVIDRMKRSRRVDTFVGPRANCLSMCVPIFLQGAQRIAAPNSRWMFHAPVRVDAFTGDEVDTPRFERKMAARWFMDRYFEDGKVNGQWAAKVRDDIQMGKEIWRRGADLQQEKSGIITQACDARVATECR